MFAGGSINMKSVKDTTLQSDAAMSLSNKGNLTLASQGSIGLKTPGTLAMTSQLGSWASASILSFNSNQIQLNGGPKIEVESPAGLTTYLQTNTTFNTTTGWVVAPTGTESIVTRAPTHEPYPYHNMGVPNANTLSDGVASPPPAAPPVPDGVIITKTS